MKLLGMMVKSTSAQSTSMFMMKLKMLKEKLGSGLEVRLPFFPDGARLN